MKEGDSSGISKSNNNNNNNNTSSTWLSKEQHNDVLEDLIALVNNNNSSHVTILEHLHDELVKLTDKLQKFAKDYTNLSSSSSSSINSTSTKWKFVENLLETANIIVSKLLSEILPENVEKIRQLIKRIEVHLHLKQHTKSFLCHELQVGVSKLQHKHQIYESIQNVLQNFYQILSNSGNSSHTSNDVSFEHFVDILKSLKNCNRPIFASSQLALAFEALNNNNSADESDFWKTHAKCKLSPESNLHQPGCMEVKRLVATTENIDLHDKVMPHFTNAGDLLSYFFQSKCTKIANTAESAAAKSFHTCSALLIGPSGSGKTYQGQEAIRLAKHGVKVHYPHLVFDLLQERLGDAEKVFVSLQEQINNSSSENILIILDGLEHIYIDRDKPLLKNNVHGSYRHSTSRLLSSFYSLLDMFQGSETNSNSGNRRVFLLCTTSSDQYGPKEKFDFVFYLDTPNLQERHNFLIKSLSDSILFHVPFKTADGKLLSSIAQSTEGKSYFDLIQICQRLASSMIASEEKSLHELNSSKGSDKYLPLTNELRSTLFDDVFEMKVLTASDLNATQNEAYVFPFVGQNINAAWIALQSAIVVPFCHSRKLAELLGHDNSAGGKRTMLGGALLAGAAGTGKTALAYEVARRIMGTVPTAKLLDVNCTSLVQKEVGASESAVHRLFQCARKLSPCIVLLDGIESIASVRGNDTTTEGTMDRILSTILVELDGIDDEASTCNNEMCVIGCTLNSNWIDPALLRPGRLDKTLLLEPLDTKVAFELTSNQLQHINGINVPDVARCIANSRSKWSPATILAICDDIKFFKAVDANRQIDEKNVLDIVNRRQ